jgi:hypothetical protein
MYIRWRAMLTSMDTGPLALEFVREANVVGTGVFAFGLTVAAGLELGAFVAAGGSVVAEVGGAVGAAVVTGADVAGTVVAGTVVTGATVTGAVVTAGAVAGGEVGAGVVGIDGNTSVGAGVVAGTVSWALAISTELASSEALRASTPIRDFRTRRDLLGTDRGEVFTT